MRKRKDMEFGRDKSGTITPPGEVWSTWRAELAAEVVETLGDKLRPGFAMAEESLR